MASKNSDDASNVTTLVLKVPSHKKGGEPLSHSPNTLDDYKSTIISALKIITIAALADDNVFNNFFSDFHNYIQLSNRLRNMGILSESIPYVVDEFNSNPPECWMKFIAAIFSALYSIEDSGMHCDVITSVNDEHIDKSASLGAYFSIALRLESYDWKMHKVELFIPCEKGERMLFIVDDEPMIFTIV